MERKDNQIEFKSLAKLWESINSLERAIYNGYTQVSKDDKNAIEKLDGYFEIVQKQRNLLEQVDIHLHKFEVYEVQRLTSVMAELAKLMHEDAEEFAGYITEHSATLVLH